MSTLETELRGPDQRCQPDEKQHSPVVLHHLRKRADDWQLHLADRITTFAGSMPFVWAHVALFARCGSRPACLAPTVTRSSS